MNAAINFRRVVAGAALANGAVGFIDDDRQTLANLLFQEVG
ncbi:ribosomal protein S12 methylthiotransferase RimO [Brucella neotomae 5K33]|nr:ribosomal protein S12 methylthiotransferase RimO [Brucella neotomae 5K33]